MTHDLGSLTAIVGFLVAMTVLAQACADDRLFAALGSHVARWSGGHPRRLLLWSVGLAAVVTAVLSLDATVVLLTPVLIAASARPAFTYASVRLANSASTLLPVSNLTNLLAVASTGLSFGGFTVAMLPVWLVAVVAEWGVLRRWFADDLRRPVDVPPSTEPVPRVAVAVVGAVLVALACGAPPWIPAAAGAVLLGGWTLVRGRTSWRDLLVAANLPLALVVLAWAYAADRIAGSSVGDSLVDLLPGGDGLVPLLVVALAAMVAANLINNLPATLLLLPAATAVGPAGVLALLIGVNVGANLTWVGSIANVLWLRSGARRFTSAGEFHRLGLVTTPPLVVLCTVVLWSWTSLIW